MPGIDMDRRRARRYAKELRILFGVLQLMPVALQPPRRRWNAGLRRLRCQSNTVEPDVEIPRFSVRADDGAIDKRVRADRRPIAQVSGSLHNHYAAIRTCDLKLELVVGRIEC
jgi:hypothetical protein